jgi:hypothetical protein
MADAALRHIGSALSRLAEGARLVAITGANCAPDNPAWQPAFVRLQERGRVVFSASIDCAVYAKHGTTIDTRLTVIDKIPADDPTAFPAPLGGAPDVATLLGWIAQYVPQRLPTLVRVPTPAVSRPIDAAVSRSVATRRASAPAATVEPEAVELAYETIDWKAVDGRRITDALYEEYALQSIKIPGAKAHPTKLVQSAALFEQRTETVFGLLRDYGSAAGDQWRRAIGAPLRLRLFAAVDGGQRVRATRAGHHT